ncbi:hypothetical protein HYH03_002643 [Edaphochlamys debaryana]|uniref:Uncharacterized protein n=1 Tax=Edaphochlamys debaryana TaxID=47281 RepID=A0A836C582_9CHLO|nr:hypothetical protein HYH03_002643 [Edaphochlamys debaryana]|eukprot:KAG2499708.1 hypothetical protein HYH03_002643 [Edaphochlamys debaryana]
MQAQTAPPRRAPGWNTRRSVVAQAGFNEGAGPSSVLRAILEQLKPREQVLLLPRPTVESTSSSRSRSTGVPEASRLAAETSFALAPLPAAFATLAPNLLVLLEPKTRRLVYLLGADLDSSGEGSVAFTAELRALLNASAAPYVHLLGLPSDLQQTIRRQLPGGHPVISSVPLPPALAAEAAAAAEARSRQGPSPSASTSAPAAGDGSSSTGFTAQSRGSGGGSVLELLYGPERCPPASFQRLFPGELPSAASAAASGDDDEDLDGAGGAAAGRAWDATPADLPDEVGSRQKRLPSLSAWMKGASQQVALRRDSRALPRLEWLQHALNTFGTLTALLVAPGVLLVRNNVAETMDLDYIYDPEMEGWEPGQPSWGRTPLADGGGSGSHGGLRVTLPPGTVIGGPAEAGGASSEDEDGAGEGGEDVFLVEGQPVVGLEGLLKAIGMIDEDSDDEEEGEGAGAEAGKEEEEEDDDDEEEGASGWMDAEPEDIEKILAELMGARKDRDSDDDDEGGGEEEGLRAGPRGSAPQPSRPPVVLPEFTFLAGPGPSSLSNPSSAPAVSQGPSASGSGPAGSGASAFASRAQSPTDASTSASASTGAGKAGAGAGAGSASGSGPESRSKPDDDSDDEELANFFRDLSTSLGDMEMGGFNLDIPMSEGPFGWTASLRVTPEKAGRSSSEALAEALRADAAYLMDMQRLEAQWHRQGRGAEGRSEGAGPAAGQNTDQASSSSGGNAASSGSGEPGPGGGGAAASLPGSHGEGGSKGAGPQAGGGLGLEGDWRAAESQAAAVATTTGFARRGAAPVPTDRLIRPAHRPGAGASAGDTAASPDGAAAEVSGATGAPAAASPTAASATAGAASDEVVPGPSAPGETFIRSSRLRRGGALSRPSAINGGDSAPGAGPSSAAAGPDGAAGSPTEGGDGPAPRARLSGRARMVRRPRQPASRPPSPPPGDADGASTSATSSEGQPAPTSGTPQPSTAVGSSGAAGAVPIPAYRSLWARASASLSQRLGSGLGSGPAPPSPASSATPPPPSSGAPPASSGSLPSLPLPDAGGFAALDLEQLGQFVLGRSPSPEEVIDLGRAVAQSEDVEAALLGGGMGPSSRAPPPPPSLLKMLGVEVPGSSGAGAGEAGAGAGGEGEEDDGGGEVSRYRWRRPGTPCPADDLWRSRGWRKRGVIVPRRHRLRVPSAVLALAARARRRAEAEEQARAQREAAERAAAAAAAAEGAEEEESEEAEDVEETDRRRRGGRRLAGDPASRSRAAAAAAARRRVAPALALRRVGQGRGIEAVPTPARRASARPPAASAIVVAAPSPPTQEELAEAAVAAARSAPPLQRQLAAALVDYIKGRRPSDAAAGPDRPGKGAGRGPYRGGVPPALAERVDARRLGCPGLPGMVRGRDSVVVLPKELLQAVAGVWQQEEERRMHPDLLRSRRRG